MRARAPRGHTGGSYYQVTCELGDTSCGTNSFSGGSWNWIAFRNCEYVSDESMDSLEGLTDPAGSDWCNRKIAKFGVDEYCSCGNDCKSNTVDCARACELAEKGLTQTGTCEPSGGTKYKTADWVASRCSDSADFYGMKAGYCARDASDRAPRPAAGTSSA